MPSGTHTIVVLIIELAIFLGLYLTLAPLVRMIEVEDIARLKTSSESFGIISRVLHPLLDYENYLFEHLT